MKNNFIKGLIATLLVVLGIAGVVLDLIFMKKLNSWLNYLIIIFSTISIFISLLMFYYMFEKIDNNINKLSIKQMTMIGIQSAITIILYYFVKFSLPFFPPWLEFQVSEIPALITGFAYGPYAGCVVILVRFLIKLPATITAGVGEAADLILGLSLILISSIIYRRKRNIRGALVGTIIGLSLSTILACFLNWAMLIPSYIYIAGFKQEDLISLLGYLPFEVNSTNFMWTYIFIGVLPFNVIRYLIVLVITFLLYKRTHKIIDRITK